jgi:hypothetical protein
MKKEKFESLTYNFVESHLKRKLNNENIICLENIFSIIDRIKVAENSDEKYNKLCVFESKNLTEPFAAFEFYFLDKLIEGKKAIKVKTKPLLLFKLEDEDYENLKDVKILRRKDV